VSAGLPLGAEQVGVLAPFSDELAARLDVPMAIDALAEVDAPVELDVRARPDVPVELQAVTSTSAMVASASDRRRWLEGLSESTGILSYLQ